MPHKWPPAVVAQLRQRNSLLEQRIQRVVCSLSGASYFILGEACPPGAAWSSRLARGRRFACSAAGPLSRDLLTSGIDSLAPQASLPPQSLAELRTAVSASSQDTLQSPLAGTARHSRNNVGALRLCGARQVWQTSTSARAAVPHVRGPWQRTAVGAGPAGSADREPQPAHHVSSVQAPRAAALGAQPAAPAVHHPGGGTPGQRQPAGHAAASLPGLWSWSGR